MKRSIFFTILLLCHYGVQLIGQTAHFDVTHVSSAGANDGNIVVQITPENLAPYTYRLLDYDGNILQEYNTAQSTWHFNGLMAGYYFVEIIGAGCCRAEGLVEIKTCRNFEIIDFDVHHQCKNQSNGTITVNVENKSGLANHFTYQWEKYPNIPLTQTTKTITDLTWGRYYVTVTDDDGCETTGRVEVAEVRPVTVLLKEKSFYACDQDGFIEVDLLNPAFPPYTYHWSNGQQGPRLENLLPGAYSVTVVDDNGCETVAGPWQIEDRELSILLNDNITQLKEYCGLSAKVSFAVSGGARPYMYAWSGITQYEEYGDGSGATAWLVPGNTGSVTITDSKGCIGSFGPWKTEMLNIYPRTHFTFDGVSSAGACDGELTLDNDLQLSKNKGPFHVMMTEINSGSQVVNATYDPLPIHIEDLCEGSYNIDVANDKGCLVLNKDFNIINCSDVLPLTVWASHTVNRNSAHYSTGYNEVHLQVEGGSGTYSYEWYRYHWDPEQFGKNLKTTNDGEWHVKVSDGCQEVILDFTFHPGCDAYSIQDLEILKPCSGYFPGRSEPFIREGNIYFVLKTGAANLYSFQWSDGAWGDDFFVKYSTSNGGYKIGRSWDGLEDIEFRYKDDNHCVTLVQFQKSGAAEFEISKIAPCTYRMKCDGQVVEDIDGQLTVDSHSELGECGGIVRCDGVNIYEGNGTKKCGEYKTYIGNDECLSDCWCEFPYVGGDYSRKINLPDQVVDCCDKTNPQVLDIENARKIWKLDPCDIFEEGISRIEYCYLEVKCKTATPGQGVGYFLFQGDYAVQIVEGTGTDCFVTWKCVFHDFGGMEIWYPTHAAPTESCKACQTVFTFNDLSQMDPFQSDFPYEPMALAQSEVPQITLFPNPSSGTINITSDLPIEKGRLEVRNLSGTVILALQTCPSSIDLGQWGKGIYLLMITLEDAVFMEKVVLE